MNIRKEEKPTLLLALNSALQNEISYQSAIKGTDSEAERRTAENIVKLRALKKRLFGDELTPEEKLVTESTTLWNIGPGGKLTKT